MSTKIKIEQDADCYSFQCTSEIILETDVIKTEADENNGYEDNVESTEVKSELENVETGRFTRFHNEEEDEVVDVKTKETAPMSPVAVLTRPTESPIIDNDISRPKKDKRNGDSLLRCYFCNKTFQQTKILTRHMYTHSDIKPYVCNVCNKGFKYPSKLREHKFIHSKEIRPYVCDVCDRGFDRPSKLCQHQSTHTGENIVSCDICKKTFSRKSYLQTHLNDVHYAIKAYVCDVCDKCFSRSNHLLHHQYIHTGEKVFSCDICKKTFSRKGSLKIHLNIHSGIKPYVCDICNKGFTHPSGLRQHKSIHTKEK